ncbi:MAG: hypothetical protein DRZ79_03580 [Candidatus Cloacimonadota bacterium]|nr:MAG: hypothetical protein DRZ79_03580 [Candidatus Cloacimonadota bacterium]
MRKSFLIFIFLLFALQNLFSENDVYMGVVLQNLRPSDYREYKLKSDFGVLITEIIPGSPADKAGLKANDIVLKIDGDNVYTKSQFVKMLSLYEPNDVINLSVWRKHKEKNIKLKLGETPKSSKRAYLGVILKNLSVDELKKLGLQKPYGVLVSKVMKDSPAEKSGILENDIILKLKNEKIFTKDQLSKMLRSFQPDDEIDITIFRDGKKEELKVTLGEKDFLDFNDFSDFDFPDLKGGKIFIYKLNEETDNAIGVVLKSEESTEKTDNTKRTERKIEISEVMKDSPAEKVGLKAGDLILNIDGKDIETIEDVKDILSEKKVGEKVKITVDRNGKELVFTPEIAERSDFDKNVLHMFFDDDNDLNIWFNGDEELFRDLDKFFQNFDSLDKFKNIQKLEFDDLEKLKKEMEKLKVKIDFDDLFKEGI